MNLLLVLLKLSKLYYNIFMIYKTSNYTEGMMLKRKDVNICIHQTIDYLFLILQF